MNVVGHAVNVNADRGFFFVRVENEGEQSTTDYFVHRSDLRGVRVTSVNEGDAFEFEPEQTDRGPRAVNVWPVIVEEAAEK